MIDNYLKTGMAVYADGNKQHFRNDCCKETFYQYTDAYHFPSFQFITDIPYVSYIVSLIGVDGTPFGNMILFPMDIYNDGSNWHFSHDFRDVVTYPVGFEYGVGCYLVISIQPPGDEAPLIPYYTDAFKICNCEIEGIGDGFNLITNGWFVDWAGIGQPNDYPLTWTLANSSAGNYVEDATGACRIISNNGTDIVIYQTILTIGEWYVMRVTINTVNDGSLRFSCGGLTINTWTTTGEKFSVFQATATTAIMRRVGITDITFTNVRIEEFRGFEFCDKITLTWWSDCDWDRMIYQYGYRNSVVIEADFDSPREEAERNTQPRLGEEFPDDVIIKKFYKLKVRIPEYLYNAFIRLPAYGGSFPLFHAYIALPDGASCEMQEISITSDWDVGNCMNTFEIDFLDADEYPVVATNCCKNEDVSEV